MSPPLMRYFVRPKRLIKPFETGIFKCSPAKMEETWKPLTVICGNFSGQNRFKWIRTIDRTEEIQTVHNISGDIIQSAAAKAESGMMFAGKNVCCGQAGNADFFVFEIAQRKADHGHRRPLLPDGTSFLIACRFVN